jgi:hypothetical protein
LSGFGGLGLAPAGAVPGIVFTIVLSVAPVTLMFYSNRSGMGDVVADAGEPGAQKGEDGAREGWVEQRTR